jgi:hypothetical protein
MTLLPPRVAKLSLKPDPDPNIDPEDFMEEDIEMARTRLQNLDDSHVGGPQRHTIVSPGSSTYNTQGSKMSYRTAVTSTSSKDSQQGVVRVRANNPSSSNSSKRISSKDPLGGPRALQPFKGISSLLLDNLC